MRQSKKAIRSKQNPPPDTVYLLQNQNDILRMKNAQLHSRIGELQTELRLTEQDIKTRQSDGEMLKDAIFKAQFRQDRDLLLQKRSKLDRLALLGGNADILCRKIEQMRGEVIREQQRMESITRDRLEIQREVVNMRANAEGSKVILRGLEEDNEELRKQNDLLFANRKHYDPVQNKVALEIEERIRLVKNKQSIMKEIRKRQSGKVLAEVIKRIGMGKVREGIVMMDRHGLIHTLTKKMIIMLSLIRRKYLLGVKCKVMQGMRQFRPMKELEQTRRIIHSTVQRRKKCQLWRVWRREFNRVRFGVIRRYECMNTFQKIQQSLGKTNLYAAYAILKHKNTLQMAAIRTIEGVEREARRRAMNTFFTVSRTVKEQLGVEQQLEASAKEQSEMLVMGVYFGAWGLLIKNKRVSSRNIKVRVMRGLKTLLANKKRRGLSEMLTLAFRRITEVDTTSKCIIALKRQNEEGRLIELKQEGTKLSEKKQIISQSTNQLQDQHKQLYRRLSMLRVSCFLKGKMGLAFSLWVNRCKQLRRLSGAVRMVESKTFTILNIAWSRLQKRRFTMLKKSIGEKIESCEFSYNYLLQENSHIKGVLQSKKHELEKSKFVNILRKLIRREKQVKQGYFKKFMQNGYEGWRVKCMFQRVDALLRKKLGVVFMFMCGWIGMEKKKEKVQEEFIMRKDNASDLQRTKTVWKALKQLQQHQNRLKRALGGVFNRNAELDMYLAFNAIRNHVKQQDRNTVETHITAVIQQIKNIEENTEEAEKDITTLRGRLRDHQSTFRERKILALYIFYASNAKKHVGHYLLRWREKLIREKKVREIATTLQRKCRTLIQSKFIMGLFKQFNEREVRQLQMKLERYNGECDGSVAQYEKEGNEIKQESRRRKEENEEHIKLGGQFESKSDHMVEVKIRKFRRTWKKTVIGFVFQQWKKMREQFHLKWTQVEEMLKTILKKQVFEMVSKSIKQDIRKLRLRQKLGKAYNKKFRQNAGMAFRIWRITSLASTLKIEQNTLKEGLAGSDLLRNNYQKAVKRYDGYIQYRVGDRWLRKIMNFMRQYTRRKAEVKGRKHELERWLLKGYCSETMKTMRKVTSRGRKANELLRKGRESMSKKLLRGCFTAMVNTVRNKRIIGRLFSKFAEESILRVKQDWWMRVGNYYRAVQCRNKDKLCHSIQIVLNTFEKGRKSILCTNLRRWRRNQYEMGIRINLMRRLTRRAMNMRVKELFYAWRLEKEAKVVKNTHEEEGQIKKRKIQIGRLQHFLQQFKKEKGLLLQNQKGDLVMSPRFQEKKDQQVKRDNTLRYRFVSRVILSMNGCNSAVKGWNNLQVYTLLREKLRVLSVRVSNRKRNSKVHDVFTIWRNKNMEFKKMFQTMERKQLIKILNNQKDKMEMEYSRKMNMEESIQQEMRNYRVYVYQQERKEKLAALVLARNAKKVKLYALLSWREAVKRCKEEEQVVLGESGDNKIGGLQEDVRELLEREREMMEQNRKLGEAVKEALDIAEMVRRISEERDALSRIIKEKAISCEGIQRENQELNGKLYLAQKEAMNLLLLSGNKL